MPKGQPGHPIPVPDPARNRVVGAVLREIRKDARLSLNAVEVLAPGLKASVLGSYERGERTVHVDRLYEIVAVYGADPRLVLSVIQARWEKRADAR